MKTLHSYFSKIGKKGGQISSPAKREAARRNIMKRWHGVVKKGGISRSCLIDGDWYIGKGRNGHVGRWDSRSGCFWLVAMNTWTDPRTFPEGGERSFRLKQESHVEEQGSFTPLKKIDV